MLVYGAVMAAGASRRMGQHKALLMIHGTPLLRLHAQRLQGVAAQVVVGLGAQADRLKAVLPEHTVVVENVNWATTGPRETLQHMLSVMHSDALVIITPVDVPPAPPAVLQQLCTATPPAVITVNGQRGHPVMGHVATLKERLMHGTLRDALGVATPVDVDWKDGLRNLNTPADWDAFQRMR